MNQSGFHQATQQDRPPPRSAGAGAGANHTVQFYEDENFLAASVADFLRAGLAAGETALIIADPARIDAFLKRLDLFRVHTADAIESGRIITADAHETLKSFTIDGVLSPEAFREKLGAIVAQAAAASSTASVRAYGEMVDILWKRGDTEGAVQLEEMWNDLATTHSFSLLCAYDMGSFYKESHTEALRRICDAHGHVIPQETYDDSDVLSRMREIAVLQQRAQSLEHEIRHRRELEKKLRDALAEREKLLEREHAARREAEAASRAKSEFLAVMSHELRTPLNAIAGHVQLVQMGLHGPVTEGQREALRRVERSQRHLLSLINDVLNLVRVGAGKVEYNVASVALGSIIADVATLIEPLLSAKKLHLESTGSTTRDRLTARVDPDKVHQILLNLLTNSIKFTGDGGHIRIDSDMAEGDDRRACIRVTDDGVGIPPEKLDKIFEPFVQLAARPHSGQDGLGLGLAISRDLALAMDGDLSVESVEGRGTTFTLTLPRA